MTSSQFKKNGAGLFLQPWSPHGAIQCNGSNKHTSYGKLADANLIAS